MNIGRNGRDLLERLTWRVIPVLDAANHNSRGRGSWRGEDLSFTVVTKDDPRRPWVLFIWHRSRIRMIFLQIAIGTILLTFGVNIQFCSEAE